MRVIIRFIGVLFLIHTVAFAANTDRWFSYVTSMDGLPHGTVRTICTDQLGFVWLGTDDGLCRFDGYDLKVYKQISGDSTSLSNNSIYSLFCDDQGRIWVGSMSGLMLYDNRKDNFIRLPDFQGLYISSINGHNDDVFIGTLKGLYTSKTNQLQFTKVDLPIHSTHRKAKEIARLRYDKYNNLWTATFGGDIFYMDTQSRQVNFFTNISEEENEQKSGQEELKTFDIDRQNNIWVGTNQNIYKINSLKEKETVNLPNCKGNKLNEIKCDANGDLWFSSTNDGLYFYSYENNQFTNYRNDPMEHGSIANNQIATTHLSKDGTLWVGHYYRGVSFSVKQFEQRFYTIQHQPYYTNSLSDNRVAAILQDHRGALWMGTDGGGLNQLMNGTFTHFSYDPKNPKGIGSNNILCLYEDKSKNLWIGTFGGGINLYDPKHQQFKHYVHNNENNSVSGNNIFDICEDKSGRLYFSVYGVGISIFDQTSGRFNNLNFSTSPNAQSKLKGWCKVLFIDRTDNLWIGTSNGLYQLSKAALENINAANLDSSVVKYTNKTVLYICQSSENELLIGTNDGLQIFDPMTKAIQLIGNNDGLAGNNICGIIEDEKKNIWVSSTNGISRISLSSDTRKLQEIHNFGKYDNLQNLFFNERACFKSKDGTFYFGGINGASYFYPETFRFNNVKPVTVIDEIRVHKVGHASKQEEKYFEKNYRRSDTIVLHYQEKILSIDYLAINYLKSEKNKYAYTLEGFNTGTNEWNYVGNQRSVTYMNLEPGEYTFKVKASNNDGLWNDEPTSLHLIVKPPFWATIWAYLFYITVVIGILYAIKTLVEMRERLINKAEHERIEKENISKLSQVKINFFTQISHELRTPLTLILNPLEQILKRDLSRNELEKLINIVKKNADRLFSLLEQLMDFRKMNAGLVELNYREHGLGEYVKTVVDSFENHALQAGIQLHYADHTQGKKGFIDADKLEKIIYNLVSNAIKFTTKDRSVDISLSTVKKGKEKVVGQDYHIVQLRENSNTPIGNQELENVSRYFEIKVTDQGVGIENNTINQLFDPFVQVGDYTKRKQGTGIGLSLVRSLVEMQSGHIFVKSKPDKGSEFIVRIPLFKTSPVESIFRNDEIQVAEETLTLVEETSKQHEASILLIEDNIELLEYLKVFLEKQYSVYTSTDGEEGLNLSYRYIPDLIITDVMLPGLSGLEICRTIKQNLHTAHIPVIMLTALSLKENKLDGIKAGADDYITKPFSFEILEAKISSLLESRKHLKEKFVRDIFIDPKSIANNTLDEKFLDSVVKIIEKNISNSEFNVETLSKEVNISRQGLHVKLKALTNKSATEFIRSIRLKHAARLLSSGEYNVNEVCYEIGYSPSYFFRTFKKEFGVSPAEFNDKTNR